MAEEAPQYLELFLIKVNKFMLHLASDGFEWLKNRDGLSSEVCKRSDHNIEEFYMCWELQALPKKNVCEFKSVR